MFKSQDDNKSSKTRRRSGVKEGEWISLTGQKVVYLGRFNY
jgi:hypothetical protein